MHITQRDFRYPQTSARSECTQTNRILTPQSTNQDKQYLTHIRGGNGSTWMRDFTIDCNHTISCRHWASSTFKFPTYRENSESTNKDSTLNLSSTHRKYRCRQYYRKSRWTGKSSFNIYQTPLTSTDLPLNSTNNHQRWTLFEITARKHLFIYRFQRKRTHKITNPTFRINAKTTSYQATQPINSIATDRGFQCNRTKETEIFSST